MDVKKLVVWEWKVCFRFFFCKDKRARSWRNTHKCTHTDTQCLKKMSWNQQRNRKRERQSGNIMETMGSVRERERGCTHKHETFQDNISILKRCVCVFVCIHWMVLCSTCGSGDSVHLVFCVCIYAYIPWRSLLNTNVTWSVRLQNRVTDVQASVRVCVWGHTLSCWSLILSSSISLLARSCSSCIRRFSWKQKISQTWSIHKTLFRMFTQPNMFLPILTHTLL